MYHNGTSNSVIQDHEKYSHEIMCKMFQKHGRCPSFHTQTPAGCGVDSWSRTRNGFEFNVEIKVDFSCYSNFESPHSVIKQNKYHYIRSLNKPCYYVVFNCDKNVNRTTFYVYKLHENIVNYNDGINTCLKDNQSDPLSTMRNWRLFHLPITKACYSAVVDQEIHNTLISNRKIWK